jgi:hypothetical protein
MDMKGVTNTISELTFKNTFLHSLGNDDKNAPFLHSLELDTITEMTNGKLLFLGFTGTDQMKTILFSAVLELSSEVTSLKTELGSVGTDMKGVTDTITELTNKVLSAELGSKTTRSELSSLRSGLAGLTSSLLATKSQTDLIVQVRMSYTVKQSCFTSFAEPLLTFSYLCPKICYKRKVKQLDNTFGFGRNVRATF